VGGRVRGGGPHQRQGRRWRTDRIHRGGTVFGAQSGLRASTEGGGALGRVGVRRGGHAWKKIEGEGGGGRRPLKRWATSGSTHGEEKNLGPGNGVRCERGGGGELRQDPGPAGAGCGR
jgi:hypothetical protein